MVIKLSYYDVHCHLPENYFYQSIENHISQWRQIGVEKIVSVSQMYSESLKSIELGQKFSEIIPAIGIHPWKAHKKFHELEQLDKLLNTNQSIRILGEVGLDHHFIKQKEFYIYQEKVLQFFIKRAEKQNLALMLHVKGAEKEILNAIETSTIMGSKVCIHWYSGEKSELKKLIDIDCYFSCGPALKYSPRHQEVPKNVPLTRLLTESDGNVKYQGDIGHPGLIPRVIDYVAEILDRPANIIKEQIQQNTCSFLEIGKGIS